MALSPVDAAILHHPTRESELRPRHRVCSVAVARAAALPVCEGMHGPRCADGDCGLVMLRWSLGDLSTNVVAYPNTSDHDEPFSDCCRWPAGVAGRFRPRTSHQSDAVRP
jgi:hypothetical protein